MDSSRRKVASSNACGSLRDAYSELIAKTDEQERLDKPLFITKLLE